MAFDFTLNGQRRVVDDVAPTTTLLEYLRGEGCTGTKEGCSEGDCGACTVALIDVDGKGERTYRAVHACISLLPMFAGREVVTVEGVGSREAPHPVQSAMVRAYGSQCGYCTPGFIASMFEGYYRDDLPLAPASETEATHVRTELADQLSGNLCRCTGYRPIRDAMLEARSQRRACHERGDGPDLFQLRVRGAKSAIPALDYAAQGERFLRPTELSELLRLRAELPDAVLVAGATEVGVDRNKKGRVFPLLLSTEGVAEIREVRREGGDVWIGGAATLTQIGEATAGTFPSLDQMLMVFAARQVRNRATLAGNLVTASPIGDLAPVFLSLDARIVLASVRGERTLPLADFFVAYRKTVLAPDEIVRAVVVPAGPAAGLVRRAHAFKVSKRRELDISIVAAAFTVDQDGAGIIRHARLAYGGVAATPIRAHEAEDFLVGRPWTDATLDGAIEILDRSFKPIDDARSGREFRDGLVGSLFEKFWRGEASDVQDAPLDFIPGKPTEDSAPYASLRHESAWGHVTGSAVYVDDTASRRRGMLEMWPVTVPHARAKILRVDTAAARAMPGVALVIVAGDIPGLNDIGAIRHDEPLLAADEISFHGQMVAMVVGESLLACRRAAAKVVVDVEPLPAILGLTAAIEAGSYHTLPHVIARGDVDAALQASPHRLEGELEIGGQEHFYLEAQAAWAERGDDDDVFVCSSTQHPSEVQAAVSHVLHLPRHKVVVQAPRMGGGFGGKETQGNAFAALAALAAWRTGRAVRIQLDRDVDIQITGKRHPFHARFSAGFGDDGRVHGIRASLVNDGGYALDLSESILDRALFHLDNSYYLPAVRFEGRVAKTHVVSHTAFRGFGGPQGMVVIEEIMDRIARTLGLPPETVRERNLYRLGTRESGTSTTHYGQELGDDRLARIWEELVASSGFAERRVEVSAWNAESAHTKRGLAITPVKFGISFTASFLNQAGALVLVYRDGTVQVNHGGTEMGQGLATKMHGVAMRALGLPSDRVRVMKTQTDKVPNTSATAASSGADLNGAAVLAACDMLKERLAPVAITMINAKAGTAHHAGTIRFEDAHIVSTGEPSIRLRFEDVVEQAYLRQISLSAAGYYRTPGLAYDKSKGHGRPFHYYAYGAAVSEVEIDGRTGMKRTRRVDILHDVGDSLNPAIDRGQIEGAFVQGMGWLTAEELKWDAKGRLLTHSASTYMIPSIGDAPADMRVTLFERATQPGVVHGSKAVGEPPLMLAISVREAIRDAIAAFGDGGANAHERLVTLPSPATHEAIFHAIQSVRARSQVGREARRAAE
jgi:xanthine dehydrogenase molybdopterin binding subunit/xanthine dehydrogenase small subunit